MVFVKAVQTLSRIARAAVLAKFVELAKKVSMLILVKNVINASSIALLAKIKIYARHVSQASI
jgi:hypothetical protein